MNSLIAIARALSHETPEDQDRHLDALQRIWFAVDDVMWDLSNIFSIRDDATMAAAAQERLSHADLATWQWMGRVGAQPIPEPAAAFPQLFERILAGRLPGDRLAERDVMTGIYTRMHTITPDQVVVDIGAQIGFFTAVAAIKTGPTGRVLAFEPNNRNAAHLANTMRNLGHVTVFPFALGAERGKVTMAFGSGSVSHRPAACFSHDVGIKVDTEVFALDDVWPADITRCDLIKIDAESAENDIVRGAAKTIAKFRPALVIEVENGTELKPIIDGMDYNIWGAGMLNDHLVAGFAPHFGMWWCLPKELGK